MNKKIVLITGSEISKEAKENFKKNGFSMIFSEDYPSQKMLIEKIKTNKIDAIIVRTGTISEEVITASDKLSVICKHGTGVDNIDIKSATKYNIPVFKAKTSNYNSVAEHTLSLMLGISKDIKNQDNQIREGGWGKSNYEGVELTNKSLGLIGLGMIAKRVVELTEPLNMSYYVYDPYANIETNFKLNYKKDITEVIRNADFLSIHCPLTEETKDLIGEKELKLMKDSAFIINTARGGVINEKALIDALKNKWIKGAALDTFNNEPINKDNPLLNLDNIILSPHIGGVTKEAFIRMGVEASNHIINMFDNSKSIDSTACLNCDELNLTT